MIYSKIAGVGSYLPERIMENAELERMIDTSDEWIKNRTGIHRRHIAAEHETTCDLAEHAAQLAMQTASINADEIDLIIFATTTPDLVFPSSACLLQERLGISGGAAFDVQAVCTGFIYALSIADKFIKTDSAVKVLVVGAETLSKIIDWTDRDTCVLFGDGAGAVVLEANLQPGIISTVLHANGQYKDLLKVPTGISSNYASLKDGNTYIQMQGNEIFKIAVNTLGKVADETLAANNLEEKDIDWLVPHQANIRIISAMAKKLDMSMDKVVLTVGEHGNTSAASIPLALDVAIKDGRIQRGDKLLLEAFGSGLTWGSALLDY